MPAARVFYLLAMTTLLGVVGVLLPWAGYTALVLDGLIVFAVVIDWRRARALPLEAERQWPRLLVQGMPAELEVELRGGSHRLRLREGLHPGLAPNPARTDLELDGRARWRVALDPRRRGEHEVGPLTARLLGPWRLAWSQRDLLPAEKRKVYPQVRWDGKVGHLLLLAHRRMLGRHPAAQG